MYDFLCKRLVLVLPSRSRALLHSTTQLGFFQYNDPSIHIVRSFSSYFRKRSSEAKEDNDQQQPESFTVSYLINSCGLSLETALSTSKKLHLQTPDKPDSVLSLLRNHGFSKAHISKIVRLRPKLLLANPEKTLLPKLEFFYSIGVSSVDLPAILSKNPTLLWHSLEKFLTPSYNFLKSVVPDERVAVAFKRYPRLFSHGVEKQIAPKVALLRQLGVRQSLISLLVTCHPSAVMLNSEKFTESVNKVIKMGFHSSKCTFIEAIQVISRMTDSTWEHKMKVYRRCSWSENEVWMAFKVHPTCMNLSEKKIESTMDYLVNKMGWQPTDVAINPTVLFFNLEKRIIPRCSVIKLLVLRGLIKKDWCLGTLLAPSEKRFLDKFVTKYQEEVPQLLNIYKGKMSLLELGFGPEEICGMKQLQHELHNSQYL